MGIGIQIKKPQQNLDGELGLGASSSQTPSTSLPPIYYVLTGLTFLSAFVALYFLFLTRSV